MDRKREFILYLDNLNLSELDNYCKSTDTASRSFYHQSSIIFRQISLIYSLINEDDMYYNYAKYGHKSRLDGFKHRQMELDRMGYQPLIDDTNQAGEAIKLLHDWLNKQLINKNTLFNNKLNTSTDNDEIMNKKGVIACLYHVLQQVSDKIKNHETEALETQSQLHKFKSIINPPTNALEDYDLFIPSPHNTTNTTFRENYSTNDYFTKNYPTKDNSTITLDIDPTNRDEKIFDKTTYFNKGKNINDGKKNNINTKNNVQTHESDLLVQQNEQLVEVFADVSQDLDIVNSIQNRINEISTMFTQFSTTLNSQLDIFENIRDNLQMSIGNIETTGENLKQSLEKEFSLAITMAYLFLIAGVIVFLLDFGRWF